MRVLNKIALLCIFSGCAGALSAQTSFDEYLKNSSKNFGRFKSQSQQEFDAFRAKSNAEFAEFMRKAWPEYESQPAIPVPDQPAPPTPVAPKVEPEKTPNPIPFEDVKPEVVPPTLPVQPVVPPAPVKPTPTPTPKPSFTFSYYGTKCSVSLEAKHRFSLRGIDEGSVANGWSKLAGDEYLPIISECFALKKDLQLCDWGYWKLVEKMAIAFLGTNFQNEARLMQMFILTQSGYKVRIARSGNHLVLLIPSRNEICGYSYIALNGCRYYIIDNDRVSGMFKVFDREFPNEQFFSLHIPSQPRLAQNLSTGRTFASNRYPSLSVNVKVNRNLVDFYNDYPQSNEWNLYSQASLSKEVKSQLYPALRQAINGKNKLESANILLNFVQTGFDYKTDQEQFGRERPLFADESLYYPYCDCEDRAILYSILVSDLLGLDVVLIHYPMHLAAAVCFEENVAGDYLTVDGKRYTVCDPTYINASVGSSMPQLSGESVTIVKIAR